MDEVKLMQERVRAKANWELLKLQQRAGKASAEQVEEARRVCDRLAQHRPQAAAPALKPQEKPYVPGQPVARSTDTTVELSADMRAIVQQLETERAAVDVEKRGVSMQLQRVPAAMNCADLVERIMALRAQWEELGDRIWYVKRNGQLPEALTAEEGGGLPVKFSEELPKDKFQLDRMIKNLRINVEHKWPGRLAAAKTAAKKAEYERKIAIGAAQLAVMVERFGEL